MPPLTWKNAKVPSAKSLYPKKRKVPKRNAPSTLKKREVSNGEAPLPRKKKNRKIPKRNAPSTLKKTQRTMTPLTPPPLKNRKVLKRKAPQPRKMVAVPKRKAPSTPQKCKVSKCKAPSTTTGRKT